MDNAEKIAQNFMNSYSLDGKGDNFDVGRMFAGLTLGIVVNTDDEVEGGRLQIFCPSLNDNPKKLHHLPWAVYVSPFMGAINNSRFARGSDPDNATSEGSIHYGFWSIPDIGAHVLVGCIDGDPRRRFWIGCMPEHQQTNTILGGRYKWKDGTVDGPLTTQNEPIQPLYDNLGKAFNDKRDSREWRTRGADYQASAISMQNGQTPNGKLRNSLDQGYEEIAENDPDTWTHDALGGHGYDWSGYKNIAGFKASRVFGWSTPGLHTFSMDDRPFNSRMRMRTTAGHQLILDDTNERIYIATCEGNNYIEMDKSGNIDIYSKRRVSVHSENDINFQSDKTIRMLAKEGIYMYAGVPTNGDQTALQYNPEPGEIRLHAHKDFHILSEGNLRQLSFLDTYHESNSDIFTFAAGSLYTQAGQDINVVTDNGSYNATIAANMNETVMQNSKRFTYGSSSVGSNLQSEVFSFQSTVNMAGNQAVTIKSNTSDVNLEAQGNGDGTGSVSIKSPNSQVTVSDGGIEAMSDKQIGVKSVDGIDVEVNPNGPKLSTPSVIDQVPEVPTCNSGLLPDIVFDQTQEFMTGAQAAIVAFNAGFRGKDLIIAVALMKITNFAIGVLNTVSDLEDRWDSIVGAFQIKTLKNPEEYCGIDAERDNRNGQLQDPNNAARLAFRIWNEVYPQGQWSANKWDAFAGNGQKILDNLQEAQEIVANLCNVSVNDFIPPLPKLPSAPALATAMKLTPEGIDLQGTQDIIMKTMGNPAQYTKSFNNMIDTLDYTVVQTDQLAWMSGSYFQVITNAINAIPQGSISFPYTFDITGLLSVIQNAGLPDIFSLAAVQPTLDITKDLNLKTIDVLEVPAYDDIVGKIFNTNSIDLQKTIT